MPIIHYLPPFPSYAVRPVYHATPTKRWVFCWCTMPNYWKLWRKLNF
nr:MAG TPA: hypothetical protein [Caudoviricetes sp.]